MGRHRTERDGVVSVRRSIRIVCRIGRIPISERRPDVVDQQPTVTVLGRIQRGTRLVPVQFQQVTVSCQCKQPAYGKSMLSSPSLSSSSSSPKGSTNKTAVDERKVMDVDDQIEEYSKDGLLPKFENTLFKRPHDGNDRENPTVLDCGMSSLIVDISELPPLPIPHFAARRQETNVGIALVLSISLAFIGVTHGISLTAIGGIQERSPTWWTFLILVYSETAMALLSLLGLLLADPGVVRRSPENSFPIPMQCEAWIQAHVDKKPNTVEPPSEYYIGSSDPSNPGDTYCVRCLVWRRLKHSTKCFHCSICQRCVAEFDHHCSVFGRCIGGTFWTAGNYKYFVTIIAMGSAGYLTSVVSFIWSLSLRYKPQIAVPICLVCIWLTSGILMGKLCIGVCLPYRACAIACINQLRRHLGT